MTDGDTMNDTLDLAAVRELLRLLSETDVTEIQIERGDTKLHIKRGPHLHPSPYFVTPSLAATLAPHSATASAPPAAQADVAEAEEHWPAGQTITAPMVGTFYSAPAPKDPPFVREGDSIQAGDIVGIVEAMKIMNEIESDVTGQVVRILVTNGQPVEYGQPLMIVEPI